MGAVLRCARASQVGTTLTRSSPIRFRVAPRRATGKPRSGARMVGWSFKPIRGQVLPTIPVTRSEREENRQKATSHSVAAVLNSKPAADDPSAAFLHHMDWRLERWISKRASDSNPCRPAWDPVAVRYGL